MKEPDGSMTLARIAAKLRDPDLSDHTDWDMKNQAAVLVSLLEYKNVLHFLFTQRTDFLATHKGQISFPGGRAEAGDVKPEDTALRETWEEIGVQAADIRVLGKMSTFQTPNGLFITPVVGALNWPVALSLSAQEVSRVFLVPVAWFENHDHIERKMFVDPRGVSRPVIYYREYAGDMVWGITAHIIHELLAAIQPE